MRVPCFSRLNQLIDLNRIAPMILSEMEDKRSQCNVELLEIRVASARLKPFEQAGIRMCLRLCHDCQRNSLSIRTPR